MKTTISRLNHAFLTNMVNAAYKFEASSAKSPDDPLFCDCQLADFYCSYCGSTEKPIEEPFSWSYCPNCKGI